MQRPILLKGHSRPLTRVKFNRDGDLLFTCGKDHKPNVWYAENGERLGTYNGHNGSVYDCDVNCQPTHQDTPPPALLTPLCDTTPPYHLPHPFPRLILFPCRVSLLSVMSSRLLTGSADCSAKLWDVRTGTELFSFPHKSGVRSVSFAEGERMFLAVTDQTFSSQPTLFIYNLADFPDDSLGQPNPNQETVAVREMFVQGSNVKMCGALWGSLNQTVIAAYDDGSVRVWDVDSGQEIHRVQEHKKQINSIQFSKDHTMIITASSDHTAKIYDAKSLQLLKTFTSDRPLNSAAMSPLFNHVIVGGGQEAMNVTITSAKVGHFEVDFYHTVYGDFLGSVKGHFGPVNTVAFNTNGKSFASGSEDGYIRLHHVSDTATLHSAASRVHEVMLREV